jgi:tetratricopeptide (TPR) repeat protein
VLISPTTVKPKFLLLERWDQHSWAFNRPAPWEFLDCKLERALTAEYEGDDDKAFEIYFELIDSCPEYLPALNNLGALLRERGRPQFAIPFFRNAVAIGLACVPDDFEFGKDLIPWYWEDNRAFLTAYRNLGNSYIDLGNDHIHDALDTFRQVLTINPGYHGIDALVRRLEVQAEETKHSPNDYHSDG